MIGSRDFSYKIAIEKKVVTGRGSRRDAAAASRPRRAGVMWPYTNDSRFNTQQAFIHDGKVLRGPMRWFSFSLPGTTPCARLD